MYVYGSELIVVLDVMWHQTRDNHRLWQNLHDKLETWFCHLFLGVFTACVRAIMALIFLFLEWMGSCFFYTTIEVYEHDSNVEIERAGLEKKLQY
jgi:hypothetical protein